MRFARSMLLAAAVVLAGCGGGHDGVGATGASVAGLSVTPAQLTFSSTGANPPAQTATVALPGGAASYTRRVTYSPLVTDWLQITGDQTLVFDVNVARLPPGVHSATVAFNSASSPTAYMTVTLFVGTPSANFVAPYVVPSGAAGDVIIRGLGFSALNASALSLQFGSTPATKAVVVSDTEIHASYPSLAAGSYPISVSAAGTSIPSRAALKLVVTNPPAFPLHTIQRPASAGEPSNLIYDAERQALLFVDETNHRILRYALSGNGDTTSDLGNPRVGRLALSPDGAELIRVSGTPQVWRLDPVTLGVVASVDLSLPLGPLGYVFMPAFANDGGLIAGGFGFMGAWLNRYDMLTQTITPVSFMPHMVNRQVFASADGRTLVRPFALTDPLMLPPDARDTRLYVYDASSGTVTPRAVTTAALSPMQPFHAVSMSRDGSRIVLVNDSSATRITVYDAGFNVLGTLPGDANPFVVSPDGNFAYGYSTAGGRVRKFSISASSGVNEVGTGSTVSPANTQMSEMTISPDGGTLFLVGTTGVVIAPAP